MYSFAKLPLCQRMLYSQNFDEKFFSMNFDSYFALENKQILTKLYNVLWEWWNNVRHGFRKLRCHTFQQQKIWSTFVGFCWLLLTQKPNEISKKCHFWQSQGNFKTKIWIEKVNKGWPNILCQKLWRLSFLNSCQPSFCEIWWRFWVNLNFSMKINIFQNHEKMENMMIIHNFIECVLQNKWRRLTRQLKAEIS